jgi:hypothetical protein
MCGRTFQRVTLTEAEERMMGYKEMFEDMPDEVKELKQKFDDILMSLSKEIGMVNYILDRKKYYGEPVTVEHLEEIRKELRRIIRLAD